MCQYCEFNIKKSLHNFFIYIPVQQQLEASIEQNWESIFDFKQTEREEQCIADIHDGLICRKINDTFPNTFNLSLVLNIDGAQVFKSSKKSLWPVQLYQNALNPRVRYIASNVIVAALYFGRNKPDPGKLLLPLIMELEAIQQAGGFQAKNPKSASEFVFMPFILHGTFDLPARAMCQGLKQYNGKNACGFCKHPGVLIETEIKNKSKPEIKKNSVYRYIRREVEEERRTHEDTLNALAKLNGGKIDVVDGFHKLSPLLGLTNFDMINGFCIDYLHCVLLGVMPRLVGYWLDSVNSRQPYYIKKKEILNRRILGIKPPSAINRKPRPIYDKEHYKGNEWRSLLLYYLRYSLPGILKPTYIQHFELLSAAIYKLSMKNIPLHEIDEAGNMLTKFANDFQSLYGKAKVTMNLHMLRHLSDAVRNCGPLWAQSMFAFEQSNGNLVKSVTSTTRVLNHITEHYILRHSLGTKTKVYRKEMSLCQKHEQISPSSEEIGVFRQYNISIDLSTFWKSIKINGELYTSEVYRSAKKSIDYCVQFEDNQIGHIIYYVSFNKVVYALTNVLSVIENSHHFQIVIPSNSILLHRVENIREKLIYMEIDSKRIVCKFPNNYEKT